LREERNIELEITWRIWEREIFSQETGCERAKGRTVERIKSKHRGL
jgi:hypothetical protein